VSVTEAPVLTPTVGRVARRSVFWVAVAVFAVIVDLVAFALAGSTASQERLDSTSPAPEGAMAVAEVLRQQGVAVVSTSSLEETRGAIDDPATTTLLLYDNGLYLSDEQLAEAADLADTVVLVDPPLQELLVVAPGLAQAGFVDEVLEADCSVPAVQRAERVSGEGVGFRVIDDTVEAVTCLGSGDGVFSLVQLERDGGTLSVLGATDALTNEGIVADGNAAFALGLLGSQQNLVWYIPTLADTPDTGPETLGELSPPWVIPVVALLALTFIAAAVWRGRRFGPLVVENLPVTVRASETMLGRARLYERSSSRLRALDSLRIGTIQRLAQLCGLPRSASVDDVIAAVSAITSSPLPEVRRLLLDADPASDRDLVELSDALLVLERDTARAIRPTTDTGESTT